MTDWEAMIRARRCVMCGAALWKKPHAGRWPRFCDRHRKTYNRVYHREYMRAYRAALRAG